jgi:predicted metalloprotease with PDZ domain
MTEATQIRSKSKSRLLPVIHYQVSMPHPESHLFEVMLRVTNWQESKLDLKMPVWTPGSYLVREYAKHLQDFRVQGTDEEPLHWQKLKKNHWQIATAGHSEINVYYRIFASELTVRTNHLDATHGYFNGAALFLYLPGYEKQPVQVKIVPPYPNWKVTTALDSITGFPNTFEAADFDTLVDSPFEIGTHQSYYFEAGGKPHELAIWGQGNIKPERTIFDIEKIVETEAKMFEGLPYDRYVFLLHLSSQGFGGLEHKNSCSLIYSRLGFRSKEKYYRFLQLVAHEFFHLWNVKRIRPKELEVFNYEEENYTPSLWFCEGTTSYYDLVIPLRAGIYDAKFYLEGLSKDITRLQTTPGRKVQPLQESSFDTWIKLYRPDANSNNSQISYYLKGEMVSLLLDLFIRSRHENQRSLDDVMRRMWQQFGKPEVGFTAQQLREIIESVAETNLETFFAHCLDSTEELPFDEYLEPFGLKIKADEAGDAILFTGMTVKTENGKEMIKFVEANSPAEKAGINAGDELLAIDGLRVSAEQLKERLQDYEAGDTIQVSLFHQDELRSLSVKLAASRPTRFQVVPVDSPTPTQEKNFAGWLGTSLSTLQ